MNLAAAVASKKHTSAPTAPTVGCANCWAAKYCAAFSLAGPQPPPDCPLLPKPKPASRPRRPSPLRSH